MHVATRAASPRWTRRVRTRAAADEPAPAKTDAAPKAKPKPKPKTLPETMEEDIIPGLKEVLSETTADLKLEFDDNQLCGTFVSLRNESAYNFWTFFPDGTLEGQRGFAISAYGQPPSIVEPFMVDEKKITPQLVIFWIAKRLKAQKAALKGTN
eukprot:scaffold155_cov347-Pavlova_lutheri.AAC.19